MRRSDRTRHSGHMICSGFKETTITAATRAILFHFFPKSLAFFYLSLIYTKEVDLGGQSETAGRRDGWRSPSGPDL